MRRRPGGPKAGYLWKVEATPPPEAEEALAALMESVLGQTPVVYRDWERARTSVTVYLEEKRRWNEAVRGELRAGWKRIRAAGLAQGAARFRCTRLRREDWAESWKRHFHPLTVGKRLLIQPTWSRRRPARGQEVIWLDPGLSFGTGHHPTTQFCLEELAGWADRHPDRLGSLLDIGCGSGILAIAGAKLGFGRVEGFDHDPDAVRVARENAVLNGVEGVLKLVRRDVARLAGLRRQTHDVVCANLTADLLVEHGRAITERVTRGGTLLLAGILGRQFAEVARVYERLGWRWRRRRGGGEWVSAAFCVRL